MLVFPDRNELFAGKIILRLPSCTRLTSTPNDSLSESLMDLEISSQLLGESAVRPKNHEVGLPSGPMFRLPGLGLRTQPESNVDEASNIFRDVKHLELIIFNPVFLS